MSYKYKNERNRGTLLKVSTTSLVKLLILHFLSKHDYYGYQLIESIGDIFNNKWKPSPGMVYPLLRNLEDNGYVKGRWMESNKKTKRYYKITNKGLDHFSVIKRNYEDVLLDSLGMIKSVLYNIYKI